MFDQLFKHRADALICPAGLNVIQVRLSQKMTHQAVSINAAVPAGGFAQQYPDLIFQKLGGSVLAKTALRFRLILCTFRLAKKINGIFSL